MSPPGSRRSCRLRRPLGAEQIFLGQSRIVLDLEGAKLVSARHAIILERAADGELTGRRVVEHLFEQRLPDPRTARCRRGSVLRALSLPIGNAQKSLSQERNRWFGSLYRSKRIG